SARSGARIEVLVISFEQVRHISCCETGGRQGMAEDGMDGARDRGDMPSMRKDGPALCRQPDAGEALVYFGNIADFDPGEVEIGVAGRGHVGDQPVGGAALLAGDFSEMRVELLPERRNAGEIVTCEAASDAGDQQWFERDDARRGKEGGADRAPPKRS